MSKSNGYILAAIAVLMGLGISAAAAPRSLTHQGRGVLREIKDHGKLLVIQNRRIPGFMAAMTMSFELADPALAKGLRVGDPVLFTITHKGDFWPITAIHRVKPAPKPEPQAPAKKAAVGAHHD